MKRTLTLPALAAVIIIGISNISMNSSTTTPRGYLSFYHDNIGATDSPPPKKEAKIKIKVEVPKAPKAPAFPKPPKPPKPPNLFKMIGEIFKFKKHSNEREKIRVMTIIDSMGIADSINASAENVDKLIRSLSDTAKQNFDSLMFLVNQIKEEQKSDSLRYAEDSTRQMDLDEKYSSLDNFVKATKDKYSTAVTEKQLNILASKIFPIISFKVEVTDVENKMERIRMLQRIRDSMYIIRSVTDSSKHEKLFRLLVKNKIPVYGFYMFHAGADNNKYRFDHLNTLIYGNIVINSQDGNIRFLNGADTSTLIKKAQQQGCTVALTFSMEGDLGQNDFLRTVKSQETFITTALSLARTRNAAAINISFGKIGSPAMGSYFTAFIERLSERLQREVNIHLLVTVPGISLGNNYELPELNRFCNGVIVDFGKNYSSTATPLASISNIKATIDYFNKENIEKSKLIVSLPFRGTKWALSQFFDKYLEDISYQTIRGNYPFAAYTTTYADSLFTMVMDSTDKNNHIVRRIFYDDENTISQKFDFILEKKLGGAAIYTINDNANYTGLWDEISYAFGYVDTLPVPGGHVYERKVKRELSFFEAFAEKFALYNYILQNPCEICYENNKDSAQKERLDQYMADFSTDSLMQKENERLVKHGEDTYRSRFEFINGQLTDLLETITIVIFILLAGLGIFYFIKMKNEGDTWKWKKIVARSLIVVANLFILFLFTWMFSSNAIPYFGAAVSDNSGYSKDYAAYVNTTVVPDKIMNTGYCNVTTSDGCINMPLQTLLGIVIFGLLIGFLITRYLIMPLLKREDIP
jgi:spore germination protein YaaH